MNMGPVIHNSSPGERPENRQHQPPNLTQPIEFNENRLFDWFRGVWQHSRHAAIGVDKDLKVRFYTGEEVKQWGRALELVSGRRYDEVVSAPEGQRRLGILQRVLQSGERVDERGIEYISERRGKIVQNVSYSPLRSPVNGEIIGALVEIADITRQRLLEEIDRDILTGLDLDQVLKKVCDGASRLSGVWKGDPKAPKAAVRLVEGDKVVKIVAGGASAEEGGWTTEQLEHLRHAVGSASPLSQRMMDAKAPLVLGREEFKQAVTRGEISAKHAEERGIFSMVALPLARGDLRVCNKESWSPDDVEFLRGLASKANVAIENAEAHSHLRSLAELVFHDVKGPLVSAGGFARLVSGNIAPILEKIKRNEPLTPNDLQVLTKSQGYLDIVAERILTMERRIAGSRDVIMHGLPSRAVRQDVKDLMVGLVRDSSIRAEEDGVNFVLDLPEKLPSVVVVPDSIARIMQNLTGNALDHVKPKPGGEVRVSFEEGSKQLKVRVFNTGDHIPAEKLPLLFRGVGTSDKPTGWGVGLKGVHELVVQNGGSIEVENVPNGVAFTFSLLKSQI